MDQRVPLITVRICDRGRAEFAVYAPVIITQSQPLNALANGPMTESSDERAVIQDVKEDCFARICPFAYTGYATPAFPHP